MQRYTSLHALYLSFYSKDLYRDVARNWSGTGFLYLLILLCLAWIPGAIQMQVDIQDSLGEDTEAIISQFPPIVVQDGIAKVEVEMPYYIEDPKTGEALMIIDTTGVIVSLEDTEAKFLLTRTQFIGDQGNRGTRALNLSQYGDFSINQDDIQTWTNFARNWAALLIYPFAVLLSYAYRILQTLLYGAIGMLFPKERKLFDYVTLLRLAVIAVTPSIILGTLKNIFDVSVPLWWFLSFLIAMGYLYFGVHSNAEATASPTSPPETPITS